LYPPKGAPRQSRAPTPRHRTDQRDPRPNSRHVTGLWHTTNF
jgi:hypothetical protein